MAVTLICLYGGHKDCQGPNCECKCHKVDTIRINFDTIEE